MAKTPNMNLDLPTPEGSPNVWGEALNTALEAVDLHDHSEDNGVPVTPAGMNINADLDFKENEASNVKALHLEPQPGMTGSAKVFNKAGDLYWKNSAGTDVQLTSGGSVSSAGSGVITASVITDYPYAVSSGDAQKILLIDTSSARTITLPAASEAEMFFMIKDKTGSCATNNITITPDGSDTIDGEASLVLKTDYICQALVSDGVAGWLLV